MGNLEKNLDLRDVAKKLSTLGSVEQLHAYKLMLIMYAKFLSPIVEAAILDCKSLYPNAAIGIGESNRASLSNLHILTDYDTGVLKHIRFTVNFNGYINGFWSSLYVTIQVLPDFTNLTYYASAPHDVEYVGNDVYRPKQYKFETIKELSDFIARALVIR